MYFREVKLLSSSSVMVANGCKYFYLFISAQKIVLLHGKLYIEYIKSRNLRILLLIRKMNSFLRSPVYNHKIKVHSYTFQEPVTQLYLYEKAHVLYTRRYPSY